MRIRPLATLALAVLFAATGSVGAKLSETKAGLDRVLASDAAVVGKVSSVQLNWESKDRDARGKPVRYNVVTVDVDEAIGDIKKVKQVKVAIPASLGEKYLLPKGETGVFYLTKSDTLPYFTCNLSNRPLAKTLPFYAAELARTRAAFATLADPKGALKAEKVSDRYFAAATLIVKYRTHPADLENWEQVPIKAEESRQLLAAVLAEDWAKTPNGVPQGPFLITFAVGDQANKPNIGQFDGKSDYNQFVRNGYERWYNDAGKDLVIKQWVRKKK